MPSLLNIANIDVRIVEPCQDYIRSRGASCWADLSDAELEEGVRDVEDNFGEVIEYSREREMIIARKTA